MIKRLVIAWVMCGVVFPYAQEGTSSPYSFNGIGELKSKGTVENRTMGSISVYIDSTHINLTNPAAYGDLSQTVYTLGLNYNELQITNAEGQSETATAGSIDYLALAFPINRKLGVATGVEPFTTVGYRLLSVNEEVEPNIADRYTGSGGLNRFFLSAGYKLFKGANIGVTAFYDFGRIENQLEREQEDVRNIVRNEYRSDLSGFQFNVGVSYKHVLNSKVTLYSSLAYTPQADLTSQNSQTLIVIDILSNPAPRVVDAEEVDLGDDTETKLTLPSNLVLGLGFGQENKWFIGADYTLRQTADFTDRLFENDNITYVDGYKFSLGGFYTPKWDSFTSYWSRITYRAGVRVEKTGLNINDQDINDFGISIGVGLPVRQFSNINLAFEYGQRGTTSAGLIRENYFNVRLSLSLNDKWFIKRKYE